MKGDRRNNIKAAKDESIWKDLFQESKKILDFNLFMTKKM